MAKSEEEFIDSLKKQGKKRISHPFYFSFIASFCVLNWKAIYLLLWPGGMPEGTDRLDYIAGNLYENGWIDLLKVFLGPLFFASLYMTYIPRWVFLLERFRRRDIVKHKNVIREIDGGLSNTQRIIGELTIEKDQYKQNSMKLTQENEDLKGSLNALHLDAEKMMNQIDELKGARALMNEDAAKKELELTKALKAAEELAIRRQELLIATVKKKDEEMEGLRIEHLNKLGLMISGNERLRSLFRLIARGGQWTEHNSDTLAMTDIYGLVRWDGPSGKYALSDDGRELIKLVPTVLS